MDKPDWTKAQPGVIDAILREGNSFLGGQLTIATSADQRAAVLGGIFAASAAAIVGGLLAAASVLGTNLIWGGGVAAAFLLAGSALCLITGLPADFFLPGNQPENWYEDIDKGTVLDRANCDVAEDIQMRISANDKVLRRNARLFMGGALLGIVAPIAGAIAGLIASQFH